MKKLANLNFKEFVAYRSELRESREVLDMSETNLYASLPQSFPGRFDPLVLSLNTKAAYRCHLTELFLDRWSFSQSMKARCSATRGVRASLAGVFEVMAKKNAVCMIPRDVYPAYEELAAVAGVKIKTYKAKEGLPSEEDLEGCSMILVCDPLKPWGGDLSLDQAKELRAWAQADTKERLVVIDSAYNIDWTPEAKKMVEEGVAMGLCSVSKGWLSPWTAGLAISPEEWAPVMREVLGAQKKDAEALAKGYAALDKYDQRPKEVEKAINVLANEACKAIKTKGLTVNPWGYFATSEDSAEEWLNRGILVLPASVFGSKSKSSILSVLKPIGYSMSQSVAR